MTDNNNNNTNPIVAATREAHRQDSGEFGKHLRTDAEVVLDGRPLGFEPGQPIYANVTFEYYDSPDDEDPETVATQKVDIAGILDTFPLDQIETLQSDPWVDADTIIYELQSQDALTHGDHPFGPLDLDMGDLEAYADYRKINGLTDPIAEKAEPAVENLVAVVAARKDDIDALRQQLEALEVEKEAAEERVLRALVDKRAFPDAARLVVQLDHHRYPVELYDAADKWVKMSELEERALAEKIRTALGSDPGVVGGRGTARVIELSEPSD